MLDRAAEDYGAPFTQQQETMNPQEEQTSDQYNKHAADSAMMTVPAQNWVASFVPTVTAAPVTVSAANITAAGLNGTGAAAKPTVDKTATGAYTLTFPTSFVDAISRTNDVFFRYGHVGIYGSVDGRGRILGISGNVVMVLLYDTSNSAADTAEKVDVFLS